MSRIGKKPIPIPKGVTVNNMVNYASVHFETEEKYMRRSKYVEYESHKAEHDQFTTRAIDLKGSLFVRPTRWCKSAPG